jgi:hypothetical protein
MYIYINSCLRSTFFLSSDDVTNKLSFSYSYWFVHVYSRKKTQGNIVSILMIISYTYISSLSRKKENERKKSVVYMYIIHRQEKKQISP